MFTLRDYQQESVDKLAKSIRRAFEDYGEDETLTAVGLVAPTAAGKTVMAAALIERLLDGDGPDDATSEPGNNALVIIWLSDQPALNKQSKAKIELARPSSDGKGDDSVHLAFTRETVPVIDIAGGRIEVAVPEDDEDSDHVE